jgi:hypothetical protein
LGAPAAEGLRVLGRIAGERDEEPLLSGPFGISMTPICLPSSQGSLFTAVRSLALLASVLKGALLRAGGVPGPASAPVDIITCQCWL